MLIADFRLVPTFKNALPHDFMVGRLIKHRGGFTFILSVVLNNVKKMYFVYNIS